jgi:hypothetical protein
MPVAMMSSVVSAAVAPIVRSLFQVNKKNPAFGRGRTRWGALHFDTFSKRGAQYSDVLVYVNKKSDG